MDSSDWSNGIRYHMLDTRPDTEFKLKRERLNVALVMGRGGETINRLQAGAYTRPHLCST